MSFSGTFQSDHSDLAFPVERVSPRLTTAEAIAERLAFAERAQVTPPPTGWRIIERGSNGHRSFDVEFAYPDDTRRLFVAHGNALSG